MRQTTPIAPERRTASERRGDQRCGGEGAPRTPTSRATASEGRGDQRCGGEGAPRTPTSRATASEGRGMRGSWRSEMRGRGRSPHPHLSCHGRGSEGRGDHLGCASEAMGGGPSTPFVGKKVQTDKHTTFLYFEREVRFTFFIYRKIVLLGDKMSKPINPAGVTCGGLTGAYQA